MHRPTAGIMAIVLLVAGVTLSLLPTPTESLVVAPNPLYTNLGSTCLKLGLIVGLMWLAHPQLSKMPEWMPPMLLMSLVLAVRWPKAIPWLLLGVFILYMLDPHKRKVDPRKPSPRSRG